MKNTSLPLLAFAGILLAGCDTPGANRGSIMATDSYAEREPITTSLFPADQAVMSDEAVARILSSKLELPTKAKLALMRFPDSPSRSRGFYGGYYWSTEDFLKLQQDQVDTLSHALSDSDQIAEVTPLPSLMTPAQISIPTIREAGVRMQADLLLVYRVSSDVYSRYNMFTKDKVKACSTCELIVLDVRTGLVPFTRVITRDREETKQSGDFDLSETIRRAEELSATNALKDAATDLVAFMKTVPKKGN